MSGMELVGALAFAVMGGFGAGWILGSFHGFQEGYWAEHPGHVCSNTKLVPFHVREEPMSDRKPMWMPCEHGMLHEHFWNYPPGEGEQCPGGRWAESADLVSAIRSRVESGTIKGEVQDAEEGYKLSTLQGVSVAKPGRYIVIGPVSDGGSET